ncbi:helicase domain-containing protein [Pseudoneobacillus sp. C159]
MNLLDLLFSKKGDKPQQPDAQPSMVTRAEPGISDVQEDDSLKSDLYKLFSSKITNQENLEKMVQLAELKIIKMRYRKLEEENIELSKRPTLSEFNDKDLQVQQLKIILKKVKEVTVSKAEYDHLQEKTAQLTQELQRINTTVKGLENIVSDYETLNSDLQQQLEQLEAKVLESKKNDSLEDKYNALHTDHDKLQIDYLEQLQQNQLLTLQLQHLQEQLEQLQPPSVTESRLETDDLQIEVNEVITEDCPDELSTDMAQEVVTTLEEVSSVGIIDFVEEEKEHLVFDEVILDEESEESVLLVELEVDETQLEQAMSNVLLKTVPTKDKGVLSEFPAYDASSFLRRDDSAEHDYLRRVINKIMESMLEIRNIEFNSTYEIDYATAYAEGIIRKHKYEHNRRLQFMKDRPYIGRVDYVTSAGAETIYIGEQGIEGHVISWKAEAASLYYLRVVGQTIAHQTLGDVMTDYIRQIDIQNGAIRTLHPPITATSQYFKDEGLVSALSNKRGIDMQSIVATLQREQYEMIRLPMTKPIIIQGSAGSGKSAIALHRLSYLLYKYQNLKADRVAILGPNEAFLKHIQNVLPTLGDFGIKQSTFLGMACDILLISTSKVKRHNVSELDMIRMKGSLDFRNIVQETTLRMFNDLRTWAKPYKVNSISIPIVPILREMEKYPHLSLKERDNLYFNLFSKSLQSELKTENEVRHRIKNWVKEKAKSIETQEVMILPLDQNEFITPEIARLGEIWSKHVAAYRDEPAKAIKTQVETSHRQFISAIKDAVGMKMTEHSAVLQTVISENIDETMISQTWQHHIRMEVRKAKESAILEMIAKHPFEVLSVDELTETPIFQQKQDEMQQTVLEQLANKQQAFFNAKKNTLQQAMLSEVLMRMEQSYYRQITKALKAVFDLEYFFEKNYTGYVFEKELQLSSSERESLQKYVKKHLELDLFDCFDEAIRNAQAQALLPDNYQTFDTYYEDLPALLHITRLMSGVSKEHQLSYLMVDEAQDYMPYEIVELNALTQKNGLMLIGDLGQNLNLASSLQDWHTLDTLIGHPAYYELQATYRSTAQIVEVGNEIIRPFATGKYKLSTETFRDGTEVEWVAITATTEEQQLKEIIEEAIFTHLYESVAVVVKDESLLEHYSYMLDPYFTVGIQTATELPTKTKVILTTPTAVKGLEFEAVVIVRFNNYHSIDFDRKLAYVATSRALHQLYITYEEGKECIVGHGGTGSH